MRTMVDFLNAWRELIIKVFTEHTLAASLVTILAVLAFLWIRRRRGSWRPTDLLILLAAWAVLVPILGFLMTVFGKAWAAFEVMLAFVPPVLGSFYRIYDHHPYLILTIIALGTISYFVWERWWPKVLPKRVWRLVCIAICVVVIAHIVSPIADRVALQ
jgi:hypothetical protein